MEIVSMMAPKAKKKSLWSKNCWSFHIGNVAGGRPPHQQLQRSCQSHELSRTPDWVSSQSQQLLNCQVRKKFLLGTVCVIHKINDPHRTQFLYQVVNMFMSTVKWLFIGSVCLWLKQTLNKQQTSALLHCLKGKKSWEPALLIHYKASALRTASSEHDTLLPGTNSTRRG